MTIRKPCPTCNSPSHRECKILSGAHVIVSPDLHPHAQPNFDYVSTDMLVLSALSGMASHDYSWAVDEELNRLVQTQLSQRQFTAEMGTYVLLDLHKLGVLRANLRYILVCGIGYSTRFNRKAVCLVFGLALHAAEQLGARKVTIPIPPFRLTSGQLNLKATAAILRCRLAQTANQPGRGHLPPEIEIFVTPQAKRHFDEGLEIGGPLCSVCKLSGLDSLRRQL